MFLLAKLIVHTVSGFHHDISIYVYKSTPTPTLHGSIPTPAELFLMSPSPIFFFFLWTSGIYYLMN